MPLYIFAYYRNFLNFFAIQFVYSLEKGVPRLEWR
ncbi:MAG: hypothetical protein KatS3mg045_1082 [Bellilinea sp.]|nr:MAG: hypothetical protein KatS3mg045_1082 [Bellilinea sp.]